MTTFDQYQNTRADWLRAEIAYAEEREQTANSAALEKIIAAESLEHRAAELRRVAAGSATAAANWREVRELHAAELQVRVVAEAYPYCRDHDIYNCPYAHA